MKRSAKLVKNLIDEGLCGNKSLVSYMKEWMDNGCQLSWLINLSDQEVEIYRKADAPEILKGFERHLNGEDILRGFEFDLRMLKKEDD